jgi:NDP-sugar pyrophosphorylase family protein
MKTLFVIREQDYAWTQPAFPSMHPLLLPFCNKPFAEFLIDFAILAGSTEIRLVSDGALGEVEDYCENGSRWGVQISYANMQSEDTLQTLFDKNRRFCGNERIMIISGFCFIRYDKQHSYANLMSSMPEGVCLSCTGGSITLTGNPEAPAENGPEIPLSLLPVGDIASYYRLSMEALETGSSRYVLPGYGSEPGCAIGRNVVISKTTEIRRPVSIGNNVQLLSGTVIGPSAIIGSNVIVDSESTITSAVILDNTYIGEHLEINGRIASANMLIDPVSGASIALEDPHLMTGIRTGGVSGRFKRTTIHAFAAAMLLVLLFIPFLLLYPLMLLRGRWKNGTTTCHADADSGKIIILPSVKILKTGPLTELAAALSLDRVPLLVRVLSGQLAIIGSMPVNASVEQGNLQSGNAGYRPAVFSYAEAEDWPVNGSDCAIVERFHIVHSTPLRDIGMTFKALLNRLHEKNAA